MNIIGRAKEWAVDGCGNCDGHLRHADYYGPNREGNHALVSGPRFKHGGVRVEGPNKLVVQWEHLDTAGSAKLTKERATKRHIGK